MIFFPNEMDEWGSIARSAYEEAVLAESENPTTLSTNSSDEPLNLKDLNRGIKALGDAGPSNPLIRISAKNPEEVLSRSMGIKKSGISQSLHSLPIRVSHSPLISSENEVWFHFENGEVFIWNLETDTYRKITPINPFKRNGAGFIIKPLYDHA